MADASTLNRSDILCENKEFEENQLYQQIQILESLIESEEAKIIQLQDQINKINRQLCYLNREEQMRGISSEEKNTPEMVDDISSDLLSCKTLIRQRGFVEYALHEQSVRGLRKWYLELLSMKQDYEFKGKCCEKPHFDAMLEDVPFFEILYVKGDHITSDEHQFLISSKRHEVRELLCFSSKRAGYVRRVCCMKMRTGDYCIQTDHFSKEFEATAMQILNEDGNVHLLFDALWQAS